MLQIFFFSYLKLLFKLTYAFCFTYRVNLLLKYCQMYLKYLDFACDSSFFTAPSASSLPTMHTTDVDKQVLFMVGKGYLIFQSHFFSATLQVTVRL